MPAIDQTFPGSSGRAPRERIYPELELRWDDRAAATPYMPAGVHSAGSLARAFGGRVVELQGRDLLALPARAPALLADRRRTTRGRRATVRGGVTGSLAESRSTSYAARGDVYLRLHVRSVSRPARRITEVSIAGI